MYIYILSKKESGKFCVFLNLYSQNYKLPVSKAQHSKWVERGKWGGGVAKQNRVSGGEKL